MAKFLIIGSGTGVGKTLVSAILTQLVNGIYWKPIQCGHSDTHQVCRLTHSPTYPPAYSLQAPLSPHHAARLEKTRILPEQIFPPQTSRPLIIEGVGGVLVPLTSHYLSIDRFMSWDCHWILVSRHYLGSINHTLLSIDALRQRGIPLLGLIFNGSPNPDTEDVILNYAKVPLLARLLPESHIQPQTIRRYVKLWRPLLTQLPL